MRNSQLEDDNDDSDLLTPAHSKQGRRRIPGSAWCAAHPVLTVLGVLVGMLVVAGFVMAVFDLAGMSSVAQNAVKGAMIKMGSHRTSELFVDATSTVMSAAQAVAATGGSVMRVHAQLDVAPYQSAAFAYALTLQGFPPLTLWERVELWVRAYDAEARALVHTSGSPFVLCRNATALSAEAQCSGTGALQPPLPPSDGTHYAVVFYNSAGGGTWVALLQ
jgi:hypothetical protein